MSDNLLIHARVATSDKRHGLGELHRPDHEYVIDHRDSAERRARDGWTHVADIAGASGEDMVMYSRPRGTR